VQVRVVRPSLGETARRLLEKGAACARVVKRGLERAAHWLPKGRPAGDPS
jgi:hypothetical protein